MKLKNLATATLLCFSAATIAAGDPIIEQMEAAISAYKDGDNRAAMNELKFAQADLQAKIDEDNKAILPDALENWTAEEATAGSNAGMMMMGGGTQLSRTYRKKGTGESVTIDITADSPMIQAMAMMLNNPMLMQSDPSVKTYRHGRMRGMMRHDNGSNNYEATFMIAGRILLVVKGKKLPDDSAIKAYLGALDTKKIEQAFSLQ